MIPQKFKVAEVLEDKMLAVGNGAPTQTEADLEDFYAGCYLALPFILAMYDDGRYPFSSRINRNAFPDFIKEAFVRFPTFGTFDCYFFIIRSIFGNLTEVFFDIEDPGKLAIEVNASSSLEFVFEAREYSEGAYTYFDMVDDVGDTLIFRGIAGIDNLAQLELLFAEMMPAGIVPNISLSFITRYDFIGEDDSGEFNVVTDTLDQIIFYEIGG